MVKRTKNNTRRQFSLIIIALICLIGGFVLIKALHYAPILYELLFRKEITLKQTEHRVNLLLLGIGGGKHDGPNLTDTIIFTSIDPQVKKVTLVSLPRDFWVPELKAKLNTAYAFGEVKQKGGGITLTKAVIGKILDQHIDYAVRVDFNGFIKAVDMVGGLDIDVANTFDDYEYPVSGKETDTCGYEGEEFEKRATDSSQLDAFPCRYEHLHFDKGMQHMNGETALKFVRSRHASGREGTDFARSQRQEKIIQAFKNNIFSAKTFLNPIKLISLYDIFKDSIDTDIKQEEYDDFIKLARKMEHAKLRSVVLDVGDEEQEKPGLLANPAPSDTFLGQWVIIPRLGNGSYQEIKDYVACQIEVGNCLVTQTGVVTVTPAAQTSAE